VTVPTPLYVIPLFLREGTSLAFDNLEERWSEAEVRVESIPDLEALAAELP
jgi:hypothetical protein